ncbi:hypothetical protein E4U60_000386 [Claviceps pazoutovae]|uniref:RBR-type E3 ubiquitin transferase n=1 Tax=Claviceps pazoutovae TaxID=1649127 RepID=A0A9P7MJI5_9HYPO|nr:hypothetical protein E4U60_000386 [Claviceps pazoutovae]
MDTAADDDDPRLMELETLAAIFPEIRHSQEASWQDFTKTSEYIVELELPVEPNKPVTVVFPAASSASSSTHATSATCATRDGQVGDEAVLTPTFKQAATTAPEPLDTLLVSHLPPLCVKITLPDGYPLEEAPLMSLTTEPSWLPSTALQALEDDGPRLWEEAGRDMVAYTYIDHLQREAEHVFGAVSAEGVLEMDPEHKIAVLDFDLSAKKAAFEKQTFECGICLDPKKGVKCHKMIDCGHVFCLQCLQDFYNDAIKEGSLSTVRCLTPNCAKERAASSAGKAANARTAKSKTLISPSELLQIGLTEETVKRYVKLKYKTELEADKDTIYCPRQWCNGAARSKKHKKPQLDFTKSQGTEEEMANRDSDHGQASDTGDVNGTDEETTGSINATKKFQSADLLCICEDCGLAFCGRCLQTWHGEFVRCTPNRNKDELTEEEKASLEYVQLHTSPCPTCNAPAQKTHGCNHMICSRCDSHFCYLCSSWLDPANPYMHYNSQSNGKVTSCYQRLWELEGGDGDDVGLAFIGGREPGGGGGIGVDFDAVAAAAAIALAAEELLQLMPEIEEPGSDDGEGEDDEALPHQLPVNPNGNPVAIAREAPLVLRLLEHRPRREPAPQPQPQPQPRRQPQPQRRQPQPQPHRGQPGGRGRGRDRDRGRVREG